MPADDNARRAEILETLVELYLRLNGYFCIRNYLQHRVSGFGLETESDVLAVRMPYQEEILEDGRRQPNDPALILSGQGEMVDCVIGEVKEPSVEFNRPLRRADGPQLIVAALRMFGVFPADAFKDGGEAHGIATDLHRQITGNAWSDFPRSHDAESKVSVRVFAPETAKHAGERKHCDLQSVLDFTRSRMRPGEPCAVYRDSAVPSASPWRGCTRRIVETLDDSHSREEVGMRLEDFVKRVLSG